MCYCCTTTTNAIHPFNALHNYTAVGRATSTRCEVDIYSQLHWITWISNLFCCCTRINYSLSLSLLVILSCECVNICVSNWKHWHIHEKLHFVVTSFSKITTTSSWRKTKKPKIGIFDVLWRWKSWTLCNCACKIAVNVFFFFILRFCDFVHE